MLEVPSSAEDKDLQDRYNRQVDEVISRLEDKLDYIRNIPDTTATVSEIIAYLRSMP